MHSSTLYSFYAQFLELHYSRLWPERVISMAGNLGWKAGLTTSESTTKLLKCYPWLPAHITLKHHMRQRGRLFSLRVPLLSTCQFPDIKEDGRNDVNSPAYSHYFSSTVTDSSISPLHYLLPCMLGFWKVEGKEASVSESVLQDEEETSLMGRTRA